jgi:hypothetical protein
MEVFNFCIRLTLATVTLRGGSGRPSLRVIEPNPDNAPRRVEQECALKETQGAGAIREQRLLCTTRSGLSLREAYRGRRAHCRPLGVHRAG